jgi:hypothetical protein
MRVTIASVDVRFDRWALAAASVLLVGSGLACVVSGIPVAAQAAVFAGTAVAATAGYRQLTNGCVATCSKDWHCNHESGLCEPDAQEDAYRLLRPAVDAGASPPREDTYRLLRPAVDPDVPPVDAGS